MSRKYRETGSSQAGDARDAMIAVLDACDSTVQAQQRAVNSTGRWQDEALLQESVSWRYGHLVRAKASVNLPRSVDS